MKRKGSEMEWTDQRTKMGHEAGKEEEGGIYHSGFLCHQTSSKEKTG